MVRLPHRIVLPSVIYRMSRDRLVLVQSLVATTSSSYGSCPRPVGLESQFQVIFFIVVQS